MSADLPPGCLLADIAGSPDCKTCEDCNGEGCVKCNYDGMVELTLEEIEDKHWDKADRAYQEWKDRRLEKTNDDINY